MAGGSHCKQVGHSHERKAESPPTQLKTFKVSVARRAPLKLASPDSASERSLSLGGVVFYGEKLHKSALSPHPENPGIFDCINNSKFKKK